MPKRKSLPKDFDKMLQRASLDELKAVFDHCEIDARGGFSKHTAIGFGKCPVALVAWLVKQGLDVDAVDDYGATPLWASAYLGRAAQIPRLLALGADIERARRSSGSPLHGAAGIQRVEATRVLLEHGANVHAMNRMGQTPLLHALSRTNEGDISEMVQVARLLIHAGAAVTDEMRTAVERIRKDFEVRRDACDAEVLDETQVGLAELCRLLGVAPAAPKPRHDSHSPIVLPPGVRQHQALWALLAPSQRTTATVQAEEIRIAPAAPHQRLDGPSPPSSITLPAGAWQQQHQTLWAQLVPPRGAAPTVQGEVIRVTGWVAREILENGGSNWSDAFKAMLATISVHLGSGTPLPPVDLREAQLLARALRSGQGDEVQVYRLSELAVAWVASNLVPIPLAEPVY